MRYVLSWESLTSISAPLAINRSDSGGFRVGAAKSCKSLAELIYREVELIYRKAELIYREVEPIYRKAELIYRKAELICRETELIYRETELIYRKAEQMLSPDARSTQTESTQTD